MLIYASYSRPRDSTSTDTYPFGLASDLFLESSNGDDNINLYTGWVCNMEYLALAMVWVRICVISAYLS